MVNRLVAVSVVLCGVLAASCGEPPAGTSAASRALQAGDGDGGGGGCVCGETDANGNVCLDDSSCIGGPFGPYCRTSYDSQCQPLLTACRDEPNIECGDFCCRAAAGENAGTCPRDCAPSTCGRVLFDTEWLVPPEKCPKWETYINDQWIACENDCANCCATEPNDPRCPSCAQYCDDAKARSEARAATDCADGCYDPPVCGAHDGQVCTNDAACTGELTVCAQETNAKGTVIAAACCDVGKELRNGQCCGFADACCGNPTPPACCSSPNPDVCCNNPSPPACCNSPTPDPCCGSTDPCCGSTDPCCGSTNPCCGSTDPCCGSTDACCGVPEIDLFCCRFPDATGCPGAPGCWTDADCGFGLVCQGGECIEWGSVCICGYDCPPDAPGCPEP